MVNSYLIFKISTEKLYLNNRLGEYSPYLYIITNKLIRKSTLFSYRYTLRIYYNNNDKKSY